MIIQTRSNTVKDYHSFFPECLSVIVLMSGLSSIILFSITAYLWYNLKEYEDEVCEMEKAFSAQVNITAMRDLPESVRRQILSSPDHLFSDDNHLYQMIDQSAVICPNTEAGRELLFLIRHRQVSDHAPRDRSEQMFHLLSDPGFAKDAERAFPTQAPTSIIVFQSLPSTKCDLYSLFVSMAPLDKEDVPVSIDFRTVALVKAIQDQTEEDVCEYAAAVIGTFSDEGFQGIHAGIGREIKLPSRLRVSYLEALEALRLGLRFHPDSMVYPYSQLTFERIVDCFPSEKLLFFRRELFMGDGTQELPEDLMQTVREFFRNDLNLAATSKQLFIHRNTLNYRLDKIRKEYGLDLRRFQDAVVFKILTEIPDR